MTHLGKAFFLDDLSRFLIITESLHAVIHGGIAFSYSEQRTIGAGSSNNTLLVTTTKDPHLRYFVSSNGAPINIFLFEDTIVAANGTPLTAFNPKRDATLVPTMSLFNAPTISSDGTQIERGLIPAAGAGASAGGGFREMNIFEWILKKNSNYLLRTTNNAVGAQSVNLALFWYEEEE